MTDEQILRLLSRADLPERSVAYVRLQLQDVGPEASTRIEALRFRSSSTALLLSILAGWLGVDRFYLSQLGLGMLKLITLGGYGIWTIIDWLLIGRICREGNLQRLQGEISPVAGRTAMAR